MRTTSSVNVNSGSIWLPATVAGMVVLLVVGVILIIYARLTAPDVQPPSGTQARDQAYEGTWPPMETVNPPFAPVPSPSSPSATKVPSSVLPTGGQSATGSFTPVGGSSAPAPGAGTYDCLCVFDIDRTLTGKQGRATTCFGNQ